jgi:hypothetical protein
MRFERRTMLGLMLGCGMLATGCATTTDTVAIEPGADTFCRIARPITWSVSDTDQTIREVKEHNAAYDRLCRGGT